ADLARRIRGQAEGLAALPARVERAEAHLHVGLADRLFVTERGGVDDAQPHARACCCCCCCCWAAADEARGWGRMTRVLKYVFVISLPNWCTRRTRSSSRGERPEWSTSGTSR